MNMKNILVFGNILLMVLLISCNTSKQEDKVINNDTIPVKVTELVEGTLSVPIETSGQFTTEDETLLAFKTGGIIEKIYVKEGDAIRNGQLLASLNMTEIKAQVQQAKIALEKAKRDNMRAENLYRDSVATLEQLQNSKTAFELAQQQLSTAVFNERYSEIRANKNGYILKKLISEGQVISPGSPAFQVNGASQNKWMLKVSVSDRDWSSIAKGDSASISIENNTFSGIVSRKSESADPVTGLTSILIEPTEKIDVKLAAGAFGKAKIIPSANIKAWILPFDAILDGNAGEGYVFTVSEDMRAKKIKIRISEIVEGRVIVTAGLDSIKNIITNGNAYLNEKSPVRIIK